MGRMGEGQGGKGRVNGDTPRKRGLGGGGGPRAGMGFGANSTQSRGGGRGGGAMVGGGERGGEHSDRSLTGRSPLGEVRQVWIKASREESPSSGTKLKGIVRTIVKIKSLDQYYNLPLNLLLNLQVMSPLISHPLGDH